MTTLARTVTSPPTVATPDGEVARSGVANRQSAPAARACSNKLPVELRAIDHEAHEVGRQLGPFIFYEGLHPVDALDARRTNGGNLRADHRRHEFGALDG